MTQREFDSPRDIARRRLAREGLGPRPLTIDPERFRSGPQAERHDKTVERETNRVIRMLQDDGCQIKTVVSEKELRAQMSSVANRKVFDRPRQRLSEVERVRLAESVGLRVIDGQVRIPDARIEYLDLYGRARHLDLEVISRDYSRRQIAAKSGAGFHLQTENKARSPIKEKRSR